MDAAVDGKFRKTEHFERLISELGEGLFVVNSKGEVLCMLQDVTARQRPNNGVVAAIEAIIADTSAAGRFIAEKFASLRRGEISDELDNLTEREREVLGLICEGHEDSAMGKLLGVSRNTVRNHIASLYRKIGVNRRGAAIIWARERGVVDCGFAKSNRRRRQGVRMLQEARNN